MQALIKMPNSTGPHGKRPGIRNATVSQSKRECVFFIHAAASVSGAERDRLGVQCVNWIGRGIWHHQRRALSRRGGQSEGELSAGRATLLCRIGEGEGVEASSFCDGFWRSAGPDSIPRGLVASDRGGTHPHRIDSYNLPVKTSKRRWLMADGLELRQPKPSRAGHSTPLSHHRIIVPLYASSSGALRPIEQNFIVEKRGISVGSQEGELRCCRLEGTRRSGTGPSAPSPARQLASIAAGTASGRHGSCEPHGSGPEARTDAWFTPIFALSFLPGLS
jgi:hypothetical protein